MSQKKQNRGFSREVLQKMPNARTSRAKRTKKVGFPRSVGRTYFHQSLQNPRSFSILRLGGERSVLTRIPTFFAFWAALRRPLAAFCVDFSAFFGRCGLTFLSKSQFSRKLHCLLRLLGARLDFLSFFSPFWRRGSDRHPLAISGFFPNSRKL